MILNVLLYFLITLYMGAHTLKFVLENMCLRSPILFKWNIIHGMTVSSRCKVIFFFFVKKENLLTYFLRYVRNINVT